MRKHWRKAQHGRQQRPQLHLAQNITMHILLLLLLIIIIVFCMHLWHPVTRYTLPLAIPSLESLGQKAEFGTNRTDRLIFWMIAKNRAYGYKSIYPESINLLISKWTSAKISQHGDHMYVMSKLCAYLHCRKLVQVQNLNSARWSMSTSFGKCPDQAPRATLDLLKIWIKTAQTCPRARVSLWQTTCLKQSWSFFHVQSVMK